MITDNDELSNKSNEETNKSNEETNKSNEDTNIDGLNEDDNPYGRLDEAQRLYLNPTIELINQKVELSIYCYYRINRYPPNSSVIFWNHEQMVKMVIDKEMINSLIEVVNNMKYVERDKLVHNLRMAMDKNDNAYIRYLVSQRPVNPRKKVVMKLVRKKNIIEEELAKKLNITLEELPILTTYRLKMAMNEYIYKNELQSDSTVKVNETIKELLFNDKESNEDTNINKYLHYFEILKIFNKKYNSTT